VYSLRASLIINQIIIKTQNQSLFKDGRNFNFDCNYSVPLFEKEGLGEILLDKSPLNPPFSKGAVNTYL